MRWHVDHESATSATASLWPLCIDVIIYFPPHALLKGFRGRMLHAKCRFSFSVHVCGCVCVSAHTTTLAKVAVAHWGNVAVDLAGPVLSEEALRKAVPWFCSCLLGMDYRHTEGGSLTRTG